jgi:hypothetical protein
VRERIAVFQREWLATLERLAAEARAAGELDGSTDPKQVAFEMNAMLTAANAVFLLHGDTAVFDRARSGLVGILERGAGIPSD